MPLDAPAVDRRAGYCSNCRNDDHALCMSIRCECPNPGRHRNRPAPRASDPVLREAREQHAPGARDTARDARVAPDGLGPTGEELVQDNPELAQNCGNSAEEAPKPRRGRPKGARNTARTRGTDEGAAIGRGRRRAKLELEDVEEEPPELQRTGAKPERDLLRPGLERCIARPNVWRRVGTWDTRTRASSCASDLRKHGYRLPEWELVARPISGDESRLWARFTPQGGDDGLEDPPAVAS